MAEDPRKMPFRQFYDLYVQDVCGFVRSWIHNPADAEEVVQEVFLIASQRRETLETPDRMRSWLFGTARNLVLNRRRLSWFRRVFLRGKERDGDEDDDRAVASASPDDDNRRRLRRILAAVEALPPKLRAAWEMFYFDDLTVEEIAKRQECSTAQLKRRLREARRRVDADDKGDATDHEGDDKDDGHEE